MLISINNFSHSYHLLHICYLIITHFTWCMRYYIARNDNSLEKVFLFQFDNLEIRNSENKEIVKDFITL